MLVYMCYFFISTHAQYEGTIKITNVWPNRMPARSVCTPLSIDSASSGMKKLFMIHVEEIIVGGCVVIIIIIISSSSSTGSTGLLVATWPLLHCHNPVCRQSEGLLG
jgi:hypothetical protein